MSVAYTVAGKRLVIEELRLDEADDCDDDVPAFFFAAENLAANTGSKVWESARLALATLERHRQLIEKRHVLELGAGTGLVGLACACLGASKVLLTDLPSVLAYNTEINVRANPGLDVTVAPLDWCAYADSKGACFAPIESWDVLVASDCVWLLEFLSPFVYCLASLLARGGPEAVALVAQTERATEQSKVFASTAQLLAALAAADLSADVLASEGAMQVFLVRRRK